MDDQRSEVLAPQGRPAEARTNDDPALRPGPGDQFAEPREAAPRQRSWPKVLLWLLLLAAIVGAAVHYLPRLAHKPRPAGRAVSGVTTPVGVATAKTGNMPVTLSGLGTVTPLATIVVQPQISGYLMSVGFKEGQHVNKGDFLAQIDPRPYEVALEQDQAQLAKDQASLKGAEIDLKRYQVLAAQNSIATQTRDDQIYTVAQDRAQVLVDQAAINTQKLNLVYCHITSPATGRVGLRQVDPGNYVTPTNLTSGIVVVTQLQPISVIFTLPEDNLPEVAKQWHSGATLQATAYDRTGTVKLAEGKLETIDNQVDTTTGTVKLRAIFSNTEETLFPNQFVNVKLLVNTLKNTVLIPTSAVQRGAPGTFVYLVKPNRTVAVQKVKLGPDDGPNVAVLSGLQPGTRVVDDGADRLKDGARITIAREPGSTGQAASPQQHRWSHSGHHRHQRGSQQSSE
jgi:membrane fusion protein, multidrug efflux system